MLRLSKGQVSFSFIYDVFSSFSLLFCFFEYIEVGQSANALIEIEDPPPLFFCFYMLILETQARFVVVLRDLFFRKLVAE